jgi:transcriptional regulator with XRE-family HTH domain
MTQVSYPIELKLAEKLLDREYRRKFFWAESSAQIAAQLVSLRKRRGLSQKQVAEMTGTKQPAISRAEQADYESWNIKTIRSYAEKLDARVRVLIQPSEDVLKEYDDDAIWELGEAIGRGDLRTQPIIPLGVTTAASAPAQRTGALGLCTPTFQSTWATTNTVWPADNTALASAQTAQNKLLEVQAALLDQKDAQTASLEAENNSLRPHGMDFSEFIRDPRCQPHRQDRYSLVDQ